MRGNVILRVKLAAITLGTVMMALVLLVGAGAGTAFAGDRDGVYPLAKPKGTYVLTLDPRYTDTIYLENEFDMESVVSNVKSSNAKVLEVQEGGDPDAWTSIALDVKKTGKATVTYTYKGKKYKILFKVVKYQFPAKTFKVGKTDFFKNLKKYSSFIDGRLKKASGKINITPAKGWKLSRLYMNDTKKVQNGYKVKKGKAWNVTAVFVNKETKATEKLELYCYH